MFYLDRNRQIGALQRVTLLKATKMIMQSLGNSIEPVLFEDIVRLAIGELTLIKENAKPEWQDEALALLVVISRTNSKFIFDTLLSRIDSLPPPTAADKNFQVHTHPHVYSALGEVSSAMRKLAKRLADQSFH
jgi:hypothetical protein